MTALLGRITWKTSTSHFNFLVEGAVRKWDYIVFNHSETGQVLAQVREIIKKNTETLAHCEIIGYRTDRGFLRRPRTPPEPKSEIFSANDEFLKSVLGLKENGLYLGLLEGKDNLKAFIDPKKLITQHLAVLAKSGAGKSYAVAVLLEELAELKVPVVVIDPHGEYSTIKNPNNHPEDTKYFANYGISAKGYRQVVREFAVDTAINRDAEQLKLFIPQSPSILIDSIPFKISNTQKGLLYNAIDQLRTKKPKFKFSDLIDELEFMDSPAKWNIITGLQNLENTRLFSFNPTKMEDIVKQGQLTIVNLKGAPLDLQEMVVQSLAATLFEQRKLNKIPPFFLVVEESHNYCPERGFGEALSSRILRAISSEGRKFGLGIAVISQRSARCDKSVLSQTSSQIIFQVTNPNDLKAISSSFEGITSETEDEVKNLPIGKALVIGAADYPVFVDVRVRKSQHGGRSQTFEFAKREGVTDRIASSEKEMVLAFPPRILPKDIVMLEPKDIERATLLLRPCISVHGKSGGKEIHLLLDAMDLGLYSFGDKLKFIKFPDSLLKLSPSQKKLLGILTQKQKCTASELFATTKLTFNEVRSIANTLISAKLLDSDGKTVSLKPEVQKLLKVSGFPAKPEYIDLPAKKLSHKLSTTQIDGLIRALGVELENKLGCYLPFYEVKLKSGETKVIDALSYSLRL